MRNLEKELKSQVRQVARRSFDLGLRQIAAEWDASPEAPGQPGSVPRGLQPRGGVLRQSLTFTGRSVTTDIMKVTVSNVAISKKGVDYPSILEKVPRIQPNKAKYLRFQLGNGQWVTSSGFDNKWLGWWTGWWETSATDADRWANALTQNFRLE